MLCQLRCGNETPRVDRCITHALCIEGRDPLRIVCITSTPRIDRCVTLTSQLSLLITKMFIHQVQLQILPSRGHLHHLHLMFVLLVARQRLLIPYVLAILRAIDSELLALLRRPDLVLLHLRLQLLPIALPSVLKFQSLFLVHLTEHQLMVPALVHELVLALLLQYSLLLLLLSPLYVHLQRARLLQNKVFMFHVLEFVG